MNRIRLSLLLLTVLWALPGSAQDGRWYEVEVIVFEYRRAAPTGGEIWPEQVPPVERARWAEFRDPPTPPNPPLPSPAAPLAAATPPVSTAPGIRFEALMPEQLRMTRERERLAGSRHHRVLVHRGWRQPPLDAGQALPVRIAFPESVADVAPATPAFVGNVYVDEPMGPPRPPVRLDGAIQLNVGRYLHFDLSLVLRRQRPDGGEHALLLNEKRRVRTGEVHLFDHPEFGVIVSATPMDPPRPPASPAAAAPR